MPENSNEQQQQQQSQQQKRGEDQPGDELDDRSGSTSPTTVHSDDDEDRPTLTVLPTQAMMQDLKFAHQNQRQTNKSPRPNQHAAAERSLLLPPHLIDAHHLRQQQQDDIERSIPASFIQDPSVER